MKCSLDGKILQNILAPVVQIKPLTNSILQVFLQLPTALKYQAGQYLEVVIANGQHIPFSIANAPLGSNQLELHIRHTPENSLSDQILSEMRTQGALQIVAPFGQCTHLSLKPHCPVIFMARGSGFAPIKAIIEQILANGIEIPMHLYWGAKNIGDQYMDELPKSWADHIEYFEYTPVLCPEDLSKATISTKWTGRSGDLIDLIAMDYYPDLSSYQVLAAGPFDMIFKAREVFTKQGLKADNMYSDAFAFQSQ